MSKYAYKKTKIYCPNCGKQKVWMSEGPGDFYTGQEGYCLACKMSHSCAGEFYHIDTDDLEKIIRSKWKALHE